MIVIICDRGSSHHLYYLNLEFTNLLLSFRLVKTLDTE